MLQQNSQTFLTPLFDIWQQANRRIMLTVMGVSMRPLIQRGDRVEVRMTEFHELRPGDIIAFRQKQTVVIHRLLVKRERNGCWQAGQKGDNAGTWSWIKSEHVLGRVEIIYGSSRTVYLRRGVWRWLHPAVGLLAFGVTLMRRSVRFWLEYTRKNL